MSATVLPEPVQKEPVSENPVQQEPIRQGSVLEGLIELDRSNLGSTLAVSSEVFMQEDVTLLKGIMSRSLEEETVEETVFLESMRARISSLLGVKDQMVKFSRDAEGVRVHLLSAPRSVCFLSAREGFLGEPGCRLWVVTPVGEAEWQATSAATFVEMFRIIADDGGI